MKELENMIFIYFKQGLYQKTFKNDIKPLGGTEESRLVTFIKGRQQKFPKF
jgi:hypothetical protein